MSGKSEAVMAHIRRQMEAAKKPVRITIARPDQIIEFAHDPVKDRKEPDAAPES